MLLPRILCCCCVLVLTTSTLFSQGPLVPPGAPAPQGKSLQQIEPRVDVATLGGDGGAVFLISAPGSYYLSANITAQSGRAALAICLGTATPTRWSRGHGAIVEIASAQQMAQPALR